MHVQAGSGSSDHPESFQAGRAAAQAATAPLHGSAPGLVVVFTTDHYDQAAVLQGVRSITGAAPLIGCCGGGVIASDGILWAGVGVLALHIDDLEVALAIEPGLSHAPEQTVDRLVDRIEEHAAPGAAGRQQTALFLADGLTGPLTMDTALQATTAALGPLCPLFGGAAGDSLKYNRTSLFVDDCILNDAIAVALLSTGVPIGVGVRHGWTPLQQRLVITRSEGNVIYEFDGRPALEAYRELFPDQAITIANFREVSRYHPVGFPQANGEWLVRLPLETRPDGAISCLGTLPSHAVAHIMHGDPASLLGAAEFAASRAVEPLPGRKAAAAIVIDCVTRPPLLGDETAAEIERLRAVLGHATPIIGMYSFGEFAADGAPVAFHNKTIAICAIGAGSHE